MALDSLYDQPTVSTKAEVRFHVHTADWIPEDVRQKIFEKVCFAVLWYPGKSWNCNRWITIWHLYSFSLSNCNPFHLLAQNKNRINKAGELLVTSELSRSQHRNLSDCIQKISAIIAEASEKPHETTAEDVALRASRYYLAEDHIVFVHTLIENVFHWSLKCTVQVRREEQGATQTEEDPFSDQAEQTNGFWLTDCWLLLASVHRHSIRGRKRSFLLRRKWPF